MYDACEGCSLNRRDFLKSGVAGALAVFGAASMLEAITRHGSAVTYPIPTVDGAHIDRDNKVILVRWQNAVYAFALACPHQRTALRWMDDDERFQCPKHKSRYQPDGTFISGRATRGMDRYALRREDDTIVVDVGTLYRQDKDMPGWQAAVIPL